MAKPILDLKFWKDRLQQAIAVGEPHRTVYEITTERMKEIDDTHARILRRLIPTGSSVLDAGCGYGRIIPLLPWPLNLYHGVDQSPELIDYARQLFPEDRTGKSGAWKIFIKSDLLTFLKECENKAYEYGVAVSMKKMIIANLGEDVWDEIQRELTRVCGTVILLEYDPTSEGEILRG